MEISLLPALLGGTLALLSPCGALLLPGYLAATAGRRGGLLLHGAVFFLGLVLTLVPLGLGVGALGTLLLGHRELLIGATSLLLVGLGIAQLLGWSPDPARVMPGLARARQASVRGGGLPRTFLLGAVGGVAGACAGPILGAVLTLALGQGSALRAGVLLAAYGAGMVIPLLLLTLAWDRLGPRSRALLRGRPVTIAGRTLHSTTLVSGMLIIALGILFWTTNGLVSLPSLVPTSVLARWQEQLAALSGPGVQIAVILALAALALLLWWRGGRARASAVEAPGAPGARDAARRAPAPEDADGGGAR